MNCSRTVPYRQTYGTVKVIFFNYLLSIQIRIDLSPDPRSNIHLRYVQTCRSTRARFQAVQGDGRLMFLGFLVLSKAFPVSVPKVSNARFRMVLARSAPSHVNGSPSSFECIAILSNTLRESILLLLLRLYNNNHQQQQQQQRQLLLLLLVYYYYYYHYYYYYYC